MITSDVGDEVLPMQIVQEDSSVCLVSMQVSDVSDEVLPEPFLQESLFRASIAINDVSDEIVPEPFLQDSAQTVESLLKSTGLIWWPINKWKISYHTSEIPADDVVPFIDQVNEHSGYTFKSSHVQNNTWTWVCEHEGVYKAVSAEDKKRKQTKYFHESKACGCTATIKLSFPSHDLAKIAKESGNLGVDPIKIRYNPLHNDICEARMAERAKAVLSGDANKRLDDIVRRNGASTVSELIFMYQQPFLDAAKVTLKLMDDAAVQHYWGSNPGTMPRDAVIDGKDVLNSQRRVYAEEWQLDLSDAQSVHLFVHNNADIVLKYQPFIKDVQPFILVIATPYMLEQLIKYGHGKSIMIDATFGTNKWKFPLTTFMVVDENNHGVPVAWAIHSAEDSGTILHCFDALAIKTKEMKPNFVPREVLIDDAAAEILAQTNSIWGKAGVPYKLCIWHVKRSWLKNVIWKVKDVLRRKIIFKELQAILDCREIDSAKTLMQAFISKWHPLEPGIVGYFQINWELKIKAWCMAWRMGQSTTSALESYHGHLKSGDLRGKKYLRNRRLDWLLFQLVTKVALRYLGHAAVTTAKLYLATSYARARAKVDAARVANNKAGEELVETIQRDLNLK